MSDIPLDGHHIREYLIEVANVLRRDGPQHTVVLVGGALLALHGLRDSTADVDSARGLEDELVAAVAEVANRHDLAPMWLNSTARAFLPATFDESECELLLDHQRLRVLGHRSHKCFS